MEQTYENYIKILGFTEEEFIKEINRYPVVYTNKDIVLKESNIPPDTELTVNYHHNLETLKKEAL